MIIVINVSRHTEFDPVKDLIEKLGSQNVRIATDFRVAFTAPVWRFPNMNKGVVTWTKRFLLRFLEESDDETLCKIDPDTVVETSIPDLPEGFDVAGDFRYGVSPNVSFLGGCQIFGRSAVRKIVEDPQYTGHCSWQDVALGACIERLKLKAYNLPNVNSWRIPIQSDEHPDVWHPGRPTPHSEICQRLPAGELNFSGTQT